MDWKARAQSLAKNSLTNAAGGAKGSALSLAVGFAVYHLWSWVNQQSWAPASPWVMPAGLAILGHFLKRKYPAVGVAMLGAVGFALATTLTMQKIAKANGRPADAKGLPLYDAALIREGNDARGYADAALIREAVGLAPPRAPPSPTTPDQENAMSAENPNATEIIEAQAKGQRRDTQDIAHDDTIGVALTQVFREGAKQMFLCDVQTKTFFDQGSKDSKNDDLGIPYVKTAAETSISKGRATPNKQAMAITGITLARRGVRVIMDSTTFGTTGLTAVPEVVDFRSGKIELIDRAGLILPFEFGGHPGFLEDVLDAIRSRAVLIPKFGQKVSGDPIRADRVPCGDATSGLRAAGSPETFNRLKLPIGFLWQPDNANADSEFAVDLVIPKKFLITVNAPANGFNTNETPAYADISTCMVDFTLRVHGRAVAPTSGNAG